MSTHVLSESPGALTGAAYFDGTDAGLAVQPSTFAFVGDADDALPAVAEGVAGIVGPIKGASGGN